MRLLYHLLNFSLLYFKEKTINHSILPKSSPFPKPITYDMENTIIYIVCNPSSGGNKGGYHKRICKYRHMNYNDIKRAYMYIHI
jgi:hypothetical protein